MKPTPASNSEMAANAIRDAIAKSEITARDITFLATSTTQGDVMVPGLASHVHAQIGVPPQRDTLTVFLHRPEHLRADPI